MAQMSMKRANIQRVGPSNQLWYRCKKCGYIWSPDIQMGGRLPRGWWRCANGCNREVTP